MTLDPDPFAQNFPVTLTAAVVPGYGRGSKELGIPTAIEYTSNLLQTGIYYGLAKLELEDEFHPMVMSLGWNPFYKNIKKSMEVHIIHKYDANFYGVKLNVEIKGFLRGECTFSSRGLLIS